MQMLLNWNNDKEGQKSMNIINSNGYCLIKSRENRWDPIVNLKKGPPQRNCSLVII